MHVVMLQNQQHMMIIFVYHQFYISDKGFNVLLCAIATVIVRYFLNYYNCEGSNL